MANDVEKVDQQLKYLERVNDERKHLETLHQTRINFYLVFVSILLPSAYNVADIPVRRGLLVTGSILSLLMLLAVIRTFRLVEKALDEIRGDTNQTLPYARYYRQVKFPPNANKLLLLVPGVITILFVWLTLRAFSCV